MSLVFLMFVIGVLNLCLGYALAVYLGYAPPSLLDAWDALTSPPPPAPETTEELTAASLEWMLGDGSMGAPDEGLPGCDQAEPPWPGDPPAPDEEHAEQHVGTTILALNVPMMESDARCAELDTRLRNAGGTDRETVGQCLSALKEDCRNCLAWQSETADLLGKRAGELGNLAWVGEEIEMASLEQAARIETTLSNLERMEFEGDPREATRRLLEEISRLRVWRHTLRDQQEAAYLTVARHEGRLEQIDPRLHTDPLTGLANRIGLETAVHGWWQQGLPQSGPVSAVLLDLDAFGRVNEEHGPLLGNRILRRVGQLVQKSIGKSDLAGRFGGQSFLVMLGEAGGAAAFARAEQLRQSIEQTAFEHDGGEMHVTVTSAITEARPDDSDVGLFQRLVETVRRAKRDGPNRSLFT